MSETLSASRSESPDQLPTAEQLLSSMYAELRKLATQRMARESAGQTLQATALVQEAWLQLAGKGDRAWESRAHFFGAAADAMRRILLEREPPLPSAMLRSLPPATSSKTAEDRQTEPSKLISRVRGDLDWIVMRALEKDRVRRYDTANGLAMDALRHLSDEAILARPPGRFYLLGKLIRRNTVAFSAGAAVLLALVAGLGASLWQYRKARVAERHQAELREVAENALANEANLRQKAESREKLTQSCSGRVILKERPGFWTKSRTRPSVPAWME